MANAKIIGSELSNTGISLEALKSANVGDLVLFLDIHGNLSLFKVSTRTATRGAKGGTALTLKDEVGDMELHLASTNSLPEGVLMVRKVLSGVNERTLRKLSAKVNEAVVVSSAPIVVNEAPASEPVSDTSVNLMDQPASTDIELPQLEMSSGVVDFSQVAECCSEDLEGEIDALLAEIRTIADNKS